MFPYLRRQISVFFGLLPMKFSGWLLIMLLPCHLLVLLDLRAAFDTIHHDKLIGRIESDLGITDNVLAWFKSFLYDRFQRVSVNGSLTDQFPLKQGVSQGPCLGPLLFAIYSRKLFQIVECHLPKVHCYADDSCMYHSAPIASICLENQLKCLSMHLLNLVLIIATVFCMGCPTTSLTNCREF